MAHNHRTHHKNHAHNHHHGHHLTHHQHSKAKNSLLIAASIVFGFAIIEALGGFFANSLTLLSDAGHMAADAISLLLAAFAAWIARRPISQKHTYGFGRAEVIIAWLSCLSLIAITIIILIEAFHRLHEPGVIAGRTVMTVAFLGFIVNLVLALILGRGEKTLNTKAALLHILSDLLGSIVALISGAIIYFTHWAKIDPILSVIICVLILFSTINLLRESLVVLMEGVPKHIDSNKVSSAMGKIENIEAIHDLHIWTLTSGMVLLTAHIVVEDINKWPNIAEKLRTTLLDHFGINHVTLQPETSELAKTCVRCN